MLDLCPLGWIVALILGFLIGLIPWFMQLSKLKSLKSENEALDKDKKNFWSQIQALQTDTHNLELKLRDQEYEASKAATELDEKRAQVQDLQVNLLSTKEETKTLKANLNKVGFNEKSTLGIAGSYAAGLSFKNKELKNQLDTLHEKLEQEAAAKAALESKVQSLSASTAELDSLKVKMAGLNEQVKNEMAAKLALEKEVESLSKVNNKLDFDLKSQTALAANFAAAAEAKPDKTAELEKVTAEKEALHATVDGLHKKINSLELDLKAQQTLTKNVGIAANEKIENLNLGLEAEKNALFSKLKATEFDLKSERTIAANFAAAAKEKLDNSAELEKLAAERDALGNQVDSLHKKINSLELDLKAQQTLTKNLGIAAKEKLEQADTAGLEAEKDALESEVKGLRQKINSLELDLKAQQTLTKNIGLEASEKLERANNPGIEAERNALLNKLRATEFDLKSERTLNQNLLRMATKEAEDKKEELSLLKADMDSYKSEISKDSEGPAVLNAEDAKSAISQALGSKISKATYADRNDLTRIKGVGPFLEKKLNNLGIYTFKQISEMDTELLSAVNDAIEFFPGRVIRDDWMGQAKELAGTKKQSPFASKKPTDLTIIEGIGPKTNAILKSNGIGNWHTLSKTSTQRLQQILDQAGKSFALSDPTTWPEQAKLAAEGSFEALEKLQDELDGGKR